MYSERFYQLALWLTPGVGDVLTRLLISHCGTARDVFRLPPGKLQKIRGIGSALSRGIAAKEAFAKAEALLRQTEDAAYTFLFFNDEGFPSRLKSLYDAPAVLFWQGEGNVNGRRMVGIVGTRKPTDYGKRMTEELVEQLQDTGASVVSGLAYGIDIVAHKAALRYGLPTFAVLANGPDSIYPAPHARTARQLLATGGLLTEQPPGTPPDRNFFLNRNRIIAGMSDVVIVVESARKGGAMTTAEYANNYGRDVYAVPGLLTSPVSEGCHWLVAQSKAALFTGVPALIENLGWDLPPSAAPPVDMTRFSLDESAVITLLRSIGPLHIDDLAWRSGLPMARLASLLLTLEFQGIVRSLPGKVYAFS